MTLVSKFHFMKIWSRLADDFHVGILNNGQTSAQKGREEGRRRELANYVCEIPTQSYSPRQSYICVNPGIQVKSEFGP